MAIGQEPNSIGAVLLAGGRCPDDLAAETGARTWDRVPFRGELMVERVLAALQSAPCIGPVVVVGDLSAGSSCVSVQAGATMLESIRNGTSVLSCSDFLIASADMPYLTAEAVQDFCERSYSTGAWFCYPIVLASLCEAAYPGIRRTSVRLREGRFTGGNMVYVRKEFLEQNWHRVEAVYAARKSPLRLSRMFGVATLVRLLLGSLFPSTLSLHYLENKASQLLGCPVKALITEHACVGTDVDSSAHWRLLGGNEGSSRIKVQ